jgi:hypothetical protein
MNFADLVTYIKNKGCKVVVYDREEFSDGAVGLFTYYDNKPKIQIAVANKAPSFINLVLVHEFVHFLQWKGGFIQRMDKLYGGWEELDNWMNGKIELTDKQLKDIQYSILVTEFHAETRTPEIAKKLKVYIGSSNDYARQSTAYLTTIKWEIKNRKEFNGHFGARAFKKLGKADIDICVNPLTPEEEKRLENK